MFNKTGMRNAASIVLFLLLTQSLLGQSQTTGAISGTLTDQNGAVVRHATITTTNRATGEKRTIVTGTSGRFAVNLIQPGRYQVVVEAAGFARANVDVKVSLADVSEIDIVLKVADVVADPVTVDGGTPLVRTDSSTLGQTIGVRAIENLPLPTRNFSQLISLVPGTSTYLTDATSVGRNSNVISVNGIRPSQNNFQVNGVDANAGVMRDVQFGTPAPESIAEVKVQTANYDATFGRAGGGSTQIVTKSGSNVLDGSLYYYFSDTSFNANNPFLKAAGRPRPVLVRNVYGATLGGPIRRERAFFFGSYQGSRERNGFSRTSSLRTGLLLDPRLTDDRSMATLTSAFGFVPHLVAFNLLNKRLPDGRFAIPTPQADGRYSTSEISRFQEEQFNANFDFRLNEKNWLAIKFFLANSPEFLAFAGNSLPGFGEHRDRYYRVLSIQDIHSFNANVTNEARLGYNFIRETGVADQAFSSSSVGIARSNDAEFPGMSLVQFGSVGLGSGTRQDNIASPSTSLSDTVSVTRGPHTIRLGGDARYYQFYGTVAPSARGFIQAQNFVNFLMGSVQFATLGNGFTDRSLRAFDYHFFFQDDWKASRNLTLNLGFRYELDLPPYDTRGRIVTFDPALYSPRPLSVPNGMPPGPPLGGLVQAGNVIPAYDDPDIPNVKSHALFGIDANNLAPRIGIAYSPVPSGRVVFRAGYGIFYSRSSFQYLTLSAFFPPFYSVNTAFGTNLSDPFPFVLASGSYPAFQVGALLSGTPFDRGIRTPYSQQFNGSIQVGIGDDTVLQAAYVGTRGVNLFRRSVINQAQLSTVDRPVRNVVTGTDILTNTPDNAQLRAPFQGVAVGSQFSQNQTSAKSTFHSMQLSVERRFSKGLQFLVSYTYAKSIDNGSGIGGGADASTDFINDTSFFDGDQRDSQSNRGVSDFDRTHRLVASYVWELPFQGFEKRSKVSRLVFSGWQLAGVMTAMSGLPINIRDPRAAELFFGFQGGGDRPSWVEGISPFADVRAGYYFNPRAFRRPVVSAGQPIPSSFGTAVAGPGCPSIGPALCTDFGNVGRNPLRGPAQFNFDVALSKRFSFRDSRSLEFRIEAFNVFNTVNFANPVSSLNAASAVVSPTTGLITGLGDFGRILATSSNPRILQVSARVNF